MNACMHRDMHTRIFEKFDLHMLAHLFLYSFSCEFITPWFMPFRAAEYLGHLHVTWRDVPCRKLLLCADLCCAVLIRLTKLRTLTSWMMCCSWLTTHPHLLVMMMRTRAQATLLQVRPAGARARG